MSDDIGRPVSKSISQSGPFGAASDVRLRQLAAGAWEVGGPMSEKQIREERIRTAAYFLWIDAGRPDGKSEEFWLTAEKLDAPAGGETASEDGAPSSTPTP